MMLGYLSRTYGTVIRYLKIERKEIPRLKEEVPLGMQHSVILMKVDHLRTKEGTYVQC